MKAKIQVTIAVLVIIAAGYWGFTAMRSYHYTGTNIMFPVGGGHVVVRNTGDASIPIEMRSGERIATFRVASSELGLNQASKRQGTGRDAFHNVTFEIPPGETRVDIASGRDVQMISRSDTTIDARVVPMAPNTVRWILILSGGIIVWALYYISSVTEHRWIRSLRNRGQSNPTLQPNQTAT